MVSLRRLSIRHHFLRALLFCGAIGLWACGGDASGPNLTGPLYVRATIGSEAWQADSNAIFAILANAGGVLTATGTRAGQAGNAQALTFFLTAFHGTGQYAVGSSGSNVGILVTEALGSIPPGGYEGKAASPGTLVITGYDATSSRVSGRFSLTLTDSTSGISLPSTGTFLIQYRLPP